jgi:hypothetical protein
MARAVPAKTVNPYATSRTDDQFATPDYAPREYDYTEPEQLGPYNTYGGPYANGLSYRFDGTPDPFRIETAIPDSYRQDASKPRAWWARVVGERNTRERTEQDNTAPYRELTQDAGTSGQRWARREKRLQRQSGLPLNCHPQRADLWCANSSVGPRTGSTAFMHHWQTERESARTTFLECCPHGEQDPHTGSTPSRSKTCWMINKITWRMR